MILSTTFNNPPLTDEEADAELQEWLDSLPEVKPKRPTKSPVVPFEQQRRELRYHLDLSALAKAINVPLN